MNLQPGWRGWLQALVQPAISPELEAALADRRESLPVLWLLGKAGAGKSSVVQRLTGDSRAEIGNGFAPCTQTAMHYDHPAVAPVMRFLDTRGLGEAHYDPAVDLQAARGGSHALLILTRVDDTAQDSLVEALDTLQLQSDEVAVLQVHTALHTLEPAARNRAIAHNTQAIRQSLGRDCKSVQIDFTHAEDGFDDPDVGLPELRDAIIDMVPELSRVLAKRTGSDEEESLFLSHRREVLGYASAAAAVDVFPALGLFAVPTIQGKLLHALAGRYGVAWNKRIALEFVTALGSGFLYRYALSLGSRQLAKLIPVYGQSAGAAAAASISFASTYAIGRAVCLYLYRRTHQQDVSAQALREAFEQAFKEQKLS